MMKPVVSLALGLALLAPIAASQAATLGDYPPPSDPCLKERTDSFTDGYNQGLEEGDWSGYTRGLAIGTSDGIAQCLADPASCNIDMLKEGVAKCFGDPASCNITLASCLPDPEFGETEPNDNLISADPLRFDTKYWAQSYGAADQDWFYIETTAPNQNLALTFAVPNLNGASLLAGSPSIWNLTIRDAAGNIFANFETNTIGSFISQQELDEKPYQMTYRATLGLVGTYYLVVQQSKNALAPNIYSSYSVAASPLQNTDLDGKQPIVGFYDSETEPNDVPSRANPLATSVSMYGLINLTFNDVVGDPLNPEKMAWAQGENDWFVYNTAGNEIITLTFCAKEKCGPGNWAVEIYDQATAELVEAGASRQYIKPLLSFNTAFNTGAVDTEQFSQVYRLGLRDPGYYFMLVNHKRLFSAPCVGYLTDANNDGLIGPDPVACACPNGEYSCKQDVFNDGEKIVVEVEDTVIITEEYPLCPDGSGGGSSSQCSVGCVCTGVLDAYGVCVYPGGGSVPKHYNFDMNNDGIPDGGLCACESGFSCQKSVLNPGNKIIITTPQPPEKLQYPLCLDGTGGGDNPQCSIGCLCSAFSGVVEIPDGAITSPYNFTWFGSKLPPNTIDTDAYLDFLNRPSPYSP